QQSDEGRCRIGNSNGCWFAIKQSKQQDEHQNSCRWPDNRPGSTNDCLTIANLQVAARQDAQPVSGTQQCRQCVTTCWPRCFNDGQRPGGSTGTILGRH